MLSDPRAAPVTFAEPGASTWAPEDLYLTAALALWLVVLVLAGWRAGRAWLRRRQAVRQQHAGNADALAVNDDRR